MGVGGDSIASSLTHAGGGAGGGGGSGAGGGGSKGINFSKSTKPGKTAHPNQVDPSGQCYLQSVMQINANPNLLPIINLVPTS